MGWFIVAVSINIFLRIHTSFAIPFVDNQLISYLDLDNRASYPHIQRCEVPQQILYDEKIFGGSEAESTWKKWFVEIQHGNTTCGGTLIAPRLVLTAAHCLPFTAHPQHDMANSSPICKEGGDVQGYRAILNPAGGKSKRRVKITRVYKNHMYSKIYSRSYWNHIYKAERGEVLLFDEAIAVLSEEFSQEFADSFENSYPYCLANSGSGHNDKCYAIGKGYTDRKLSRSERRRIKPKDVQQVKIKIRNLCPGFHNKRIRCMDHAVTQGDSGGPIFCKLQNSNNRAYLMGITSMVEGGSESYGIVHYLLNKERWIEKFLRSPAAAPVNLSRCYTINELFMYF